MLLAVLKVCLLTRVPKRRRHWCRYESTERCTQSQVFWESSFHGRVLVHGRFNPKEGITVAWKIPDTILNGTTVSNGAGDFEIHIQDVNNVMYFDCMSGKKTHDECTAQLDTVKFVLTLSEVDTEGTTLNSQFTCQDGVTICGGFDPVTKVACEVEAKTDKEKEACYFPPAEYNLAATYLKFEREDLDKQLLYYTPIAPFDGRVYFPLAQHTFAATDATSTLSTALPAPLMDAARNKCFIRTAQVCVNNYAMGEAPVKCIFTGPDGRFHVAVALHSKVTVTVKYHSHTFLFDGQNVATKHVFSLASTDPLNDPNNGQQEKQVTVFDVTDATGQPTPLPAPRCADL